MRPTLVALALALALVHSQGSALAQAAGVAIYTEMIASTAAVIRDSCHAGTAGSEWQTRFRPLSLAW